MSTILVLGGTGKTGRRVAARLRARGAEVRAASRRGETRFDWYDHDTWEPALSGVSAAYLVDSQGPDAAGLLAAFAGAAVARGCGGWCCCRPVTGPSSVTTACWPPSGRSRRPAARGRSCGRLGSRRTSARTRCCATRSTPGWSSCPLDHGLEPFVHADDIADVAAEVLLRDGHAGRTYELSGPRLLSFGDAIGEIAAATGRSITYVPVSPEEHAARLAARGFDADHIALVNRLFASIDAGTNAHLSDGVRQVLGREPRDFTEYVESTW
ncbi:NAD(P)H-binding protein [Nonomuraea ferruginea]